MSSSDFKFTYIYNFATQFVQLILKCGLWNQGDGVKQSRPLDTHNTIINRHCMGAGEYLKVTVPEVSARGSPREEEGGG